MFLTHGIGLLLASSRALAALSVDTQTQQQNAAQSLVEGPSGLASYYDHGSNGVFSTLDSWQWWVSAKLWNTFLRYQDITGDKSYNNTIQAALVDQAGKGNDFMGQYTKGNDDQMWWGIAAITAAEIGLPSPPSSPSWLQMAINVYDQVNDRWDGATCGGGLGWQISPDADGYHYKNAITNGLFFQLSARLGAVTGDDQYTSRAVTAWNWSQSVGLVEKGTYKVYDGTDAKKGCIDLDHDQWSYNVGVYLYGAAVMQSHTGDSDTWAPHVDGLIGAAQAGFSNNGVLVETMCEPKGTCNADQVAFKACLARWLSATASLVPSTRDQINPILHSSAHAAVSSCNAGEDNNKCGTSWTMHGSDGKTGVSQQMAAVEVVLGVLSDGQVPMNGHARHSRRSGV